MIPAIDAHVHFWQYDPRRDTWIDNRMKVLQQDYLPQQLLGTLKRNNVSGCIAVQADQSEVETRFLSELALTHEFILGVVGWIDLRSANIEERLQHFTQYSPIKGYRHIAQAEAPGFFGDVQFRNGIRALNNFGYTYDILVYHHQLNELPDFLDAFPDQPFVIDHLAKPAIGKKEIDNWKEQIRRAAQYPNVYCKLSGLFTEAKWKDWKAGEFYPYLDIVFEAFGTQRLMYASDWPVMLLSGIYVQWKSLLEKYMEPLSEEDRELVLRSNALRFYRIEDINDTEA